MERFRAWLPSPIRAAADNLRSLWPVALVLASIAIAACNSNGGGGY